jgi:hypothetical protein
VWNGIKSAITTPIEAARDAVRTAIDTMKGFFNFSWELPKIKLPHFSIEGSFSLDPPSVPHLGVDWYKNGGILTDPTIFGMAGGRLLGGGEAGAEAVAPLSDLQSFIQAAVNNGLKNNAGYYQTINITTPDAVSPAEVARQTRLATRNMVTRMKGGV